jgi:DNA-binding response OmpR family regulator
MKSLLGKRLKSEDLSVKTGDLRFGASLRELIKGERPIILTDTEGRLMHILMKNAGSIVTY